MLILTIVQLDITLEFYFNFSFHFICLYKCLKFGLCICACDYSEGYCECMQRRDQVELLLFDCEPERTLH